MDPIVTAIVSYGMSGRVFHAPLIHSNDKFKLHSIVERSHKGSQDRFPYVNILKDFDEVLATDDIELVIINTPDHTHFTLTKQALEAGKHVVVEKPFVLKAREAEILIDLAEEKGVRLSVFHNRRWDGDFLTVKKVINEQMLGRLVSYEAHYDRYRNYIVANTWKENSLGGAEILYNLGSHMIDQTCQLFGLPQYVYAEMGVQRTGGEVDDYYNLILGYVGISVNLKASYLVKEEGPRYILHGTDGSFLKWGMDPQEEALKEGYLPDSPDWGKEEQKYWGKLNTTINGAHVKERIETVPGNYSYFYDNIYKAIRENKTMEVKPEEAGNIITIIESAIESNNTGKRIELQW